MRGFDNGQIHTFESRYCCRPLSLIDPWSRLPFAKMQLFVTVYAYEEMVTEAATLRKIVDVMTTKRIERPARHDHSSLLGAPLRN